MLLFGVTWQKSVSQSFATSKSAALEIDLSPWLNLGFSLALTICES